MTKSLVLFAIFTGFALSACSAGISPQPTPDDNGDMEEGAIFIDSTDLLIAESFPVQIFLHVVGNTPTPCHHFTAEVAAPDEQNRIHVRIYTMVNPTLMCAQVLQPFDESVAILMEGAADGAYSVYVNGELVGEFTYPG
jgi:hypothetical protein